LGPIDPILGPSVPAREAPMSGGRGLVALGGAMQVRGMNNETVI
jgi:hypothetical protein